jgi:hypothetical protein
MSARRTFMVVILAALIALPGSAYAAFQYPETPVYTPNWNQAALATQTQTPPHTFGLVTPTYIPPGVSANGVYTTPIPKGSKGTTATYNLDWTIGSAGKSGCLVCHGDKNLRRVVGGVSVSMYVNTVVLENSAHAKLLCTDCHVDFAYKVPHVSGQAGETWRVVAKSSCKSCHQPEFLEWAKSSHSLAVSASGTSSSTLGRPGSTAPGKPRPMCGDCHDGHTIPKKTDVAGKEAVHASGLTMCGKCHVQYAENYDDYYHGAAYRRGAKDAPACWQCHNTHQILPTADRLSSTNPDHLVATCSQCHETASPGYVTYAPLIHQRAAAYAKNPIYSAVDTATTAIENMFQSVMSAFKKSGS